MDEKCLKKKAFFAKITTPPFSFLGTNMHRPSVNSGAISSLSWVLETWLFKDTSHNPSHTGTWKMRETSVRVLKRSYFKWSARQLTSYLFWFWILQESAQLSIMKNGIQRYLKGPFFQLVKNVENSSPKMNCSRKWAKKLCNNYLIQCLPHN